jgi:hypothetical protein
VRQENEYSRQPVYNNPDGGLIHLPDKKFEILPEAWASITVECNLRHSVAELSEELVTRLISRDNILDFPFVVHVTQSSKAT